MDKEAFYDAEIGPALLAIAKKCEAAGISIAAMVEWEPGETGRTVAIQQDAGVGIRIAEMAMRCHGNADSLIGALVKYGREHGHNSVYLSLLSRDPA